MKNFVKTSCVFLFILTTVVVFPANTLSTQEEMTSLTVAKTDHSASSISVMSSADHQVFTHNRMASANSLQPINLLKYPVRSAEILVNLPIFKADYVLFAFGLIGYIVFRRRTS